MIFSVGDTYTIDERPELSITKDKEFMKIKDLPKIDRPREKLEKYGSEVNPPPTGGFRG